MVITHAHDTWPEAIGKTAHCAGCQTEYPAFDCLSVATNSEVSGNVQVTMFLICAKCVIEKAAPIGRC